VFWVTRQVRHECVRLIFGIPQGEDVVRDDMQYGGSYTSPVSPGPVRLFTHSPLS
jgi:hypothetical protein